MSAQTELAQARFNMVEQQVRTWDVLDYRVLDVLHELPREAFVQEAHALMAYADVELPVLPGYSEKLFKPVVDGRVLQSLGLKGDEDILEIGTGSGYTTACLAKLGRFVTTIEHREAIFQQAKARFQAQQYYNIKAILGDALNTKHDHQFDVVVIGAAVADIPGQVWTWLKPTGKAFLVRGESPVMEAILLTGTEKSPHIHSLFETDLAYLQGCEPKTKRFQI